MVGGVKCDLILLSLSDNISKRIGTTRTTQSLFVKQPSLSSLNNLHVPRFVSLMSRGPAR